MNSACTECRALARELREALAEAVTDGKIRESSTAMLQLIQGEAGDDDARLRWLRTDEISRLQLSRTGRAYHAALVHWVRSGHKMSLATGFGIVPPDTR